jgi:hypothetical protein
VEEQFGSQKLQTGKSKEKEILQPDDTLVITGSHKAVDVVFTLLSEKPE